MCCVYMCMYIYILYIYLDGSSLKCCNLIDQLEVSKSCSKPTFN